MSSYAAAKLLIVPLLKEHGVLNQSRLVDLTQCDSNHVSSAMKGLCREGKAKSIGRAGELGMTQFRPHARLFALADYVIPRKGIEAPIADPDAIAGGEYRMPAKKTYQSFVYPGGRSHRGSNQ